MEMARMEYNHSAFFWLTHTSINGLLLQQESAPDSRVLVSQDLAELPFKRADPSWYRIA